MSAEEQNQLLEVNNDNGCCLLLVSWHHVCSLCRECDLVPNSHVTEVWWAVGNWAAVSTSVLWEVLRALCKQLQNLVVLLTPLKQLICLIARNNFYKESYFPPEGLLKQWAAYTPFPFHPFCILNIFKFVLYSPVNKELEKQQAGSVIVLKWNWGQLYSNWNGGSANF